MLWKGGDGWCVSVWGRKQQWKAGAVPLASVQLSSIKVSRCWSCDTHVTCPNCLFFVMVEICHYICDGQAPRAATAAGGQ